jgi:nucleotide-binding universal stress UspA family protein
VRYKKVLVPLDGSKRAEKILPHVEELAHRYEAKVILLQVVEYQTAVSPEGAYMPMTQTQIDELKQEAESYLTGLANSLKQKSIQCTARVVYGPVVESITNSAERENVDLIAMASHGRSGLARVFYGSIAAGILQNVDRPLLLIRSRSDD